MDDGGSKRRAAFRLAACIAFGLLALPVPALGAAAAPPARGTSAEPGGTELKRALEGLLGEELDIVGGFGTRDDPILVSSRSPTDAVTTEMRVLDALAYDRQALWHALGVAIVPHGSERLLQHKIEVVRLVPQQIHRTVENYYVRRIGLAEPLAGYDAAAIVHRSPEIRVLWPFQIGWLHYRGTHRYPQPELGYSLKYEARAITADVYVYPMAGRPPSSSPHFDELGRAISDIVVRYGKNYTAHDWPPQDSTTHAFYYYIPTAAPDKLSCVMVTSKVEHFVKIRFTMVDNYLTRNIMNDFTDGVLALAGRPQPEGAPSPVYRTEPPPTDSQ